MRPSTLIPLALLIVPIMEIAVFILIGEQIGLLATLAMIFVTAVIGTFLLRWQGFSIINRIQIESNAGRIPGRELGHGAMILVAGVLLLTPGFVTDALGFALFVPPIREGIWRLLASRLKVHVVSPGAPRGEPVVDLDDAEWQTNPDPTSPWNKDDGPNRRLN